MINNIRDLRERLKIRQDAFSQITGISQALLSNYESGKSSPGIENAFKIARALNVSLEEIFSDKESSVKKVVDEIGPLSEDEKEMIKDFRSVRSKREIAMIKDIMDGFSLRKKK